MVPPRHYERLARLLLELVGEALSPGVPASAATSLGRAFGRRRTAEELSTGGEQPPRLSPDAVPDWMDLAGYGATLASTAGGGVVIEVRNCVYEELSKEYSDVVCAFDRGMFGGMLGCSPSAHTQTHAIQAGDVYCRHEFRL